MQRMTTYAIGADRIEALISRETRARTRFLVVCSVALAATLAARFLNPKLFQNSGRWIFVVMFVLCVQPIARALWNGGRWQEKTRAACRKFRVETAGDTVHLSNAWGVDVLLHASELPRAEEAEWSRGLILRTLNRYRYFRVPHTLEGYESFKRDLAEMGILVVQRKLLTNWEEFLFIAVYCGTMLCALLAGNPRILTVNLIVAAVAALFGLFVVRANAAPAVRGVGGAVGVFLPAIYAAGALWVSVHGW
jgi:hypothetical protein